MKLKMILLSALVFTFGILIATTPVSAQAEKKKKQQDKKPAAANKQKESAKKQEEKKRSADDKDKRKEKESDRKPKEPTRKDKANQTPPDVTAFVREHHPEIEKYLKELKKNSPQLYRRGVSEIARNANRLEALKARNPELHQQMLEIWKIESRIKLAAARFALTENEKFKIELESLVEKRLELQKTRLYSERERLEERLSKLNTQIESFESTKDDMAKKRIDQYLRRFKTQAKRIRDAK